MSAGQQLGRCESAIRWIAVIIAMAPALAASALADEDEIQVAQNLTQPTQDRTQLGGQIEQVIVTARKREEDLQTVPQSITTYTGEKLEAQSVQSLSDIGQITPNFLYGEKIQSGSSAGQIYIRGIGQQDTNAAFSPAVGIFVDGVYLGRAQGNDLEMSDVERVEVLYGPQGTLFGKNSNGGAINIITKKPDPSAAGPGGTFSLQTGNYGRFDALGTVNVPLAGDWAALELSGAYFRQDGYSKRTDGEDQADQNRASMRAQLLLKPTDTLEAILRVDATPFDERNAAYRLVHVWPSANVPVLYATQTPYRYDDRWVTASDFSYNGTGPNKNQGFVWGTSLTLTWDQPWATLKSISAYRRLDVKSDFDPDGSPLTVLDVLNTVNQHQVSQELQATGTSFGGRLNWVTGLYFFDETAHDNEALNIATEFFDGAANVDRHLVVTNRNFAAYGQATYNLTDSLKLNVGARAGVDDVDAGRLELNYPTPTIFQPFVSGSASWTSFLPRVGLDYQWTPDFMIYASAAEGSKTGGFNGRAASTIEFNRFDPEYVWTYEVGLRSEWWKNRLLFNATAFYSDYTDFQIQQNRATIDPATGHPVAFSFVGNMPRATVRGGEATILALPLPEFQLSVGMGIIDASYDEVIPGAPVTTHSQFVNAPKFTVTVGAEYTLDLADLGQIVSRVDYTHKSKIQYDYGNSPLIAQDPYGLLNARFTWQPLNSPWSFFVFGTNLTNTHYAVGGIDDTPGGSLGEVVKLMGAPIEWGLGAKYRFD